MIKSMTGYGRGEYLDTISSTVEIRSVNHRFLEIFVRLPKPWLSVEEKIKNFVKDKISRGRLDIFVNISCENIPVEIEIDKNIVNNYYKKLVEVKNEIGFEGEISLSLLSLLPNFLQLEEKFPQEEELWSSLVHALEEAIDNLIEMRTFEGNNLWQDISKRLDLIGKSVEVIESFADRNPQEYRKKLLQDIEKLTSGISLDNDRIETEVAFFAEKTNITEEIIRIKSHIKQMKSLFTLDDPVGKKMDFILQEINREANTIGSKSLDYNISKEVINIKSELEKIREQVQNIE